MPLPPWAIARATRVIAQVPELDRKLVDRGASIRALAAMFRDAGSGGRTQSTRPGTYRPAPAPGRAPGSCGPCSRTCATRT